MLKATSKFTKIEFHKQIEALGNSLINISINDIICPLFFRNTTKRVSHYCKSHHITIVNCEINNCHFAGDMFVTTIKELLVEHPFIKTIRISEHNEEDHCFSNADVFNLHNYLHQYQKDIIIILPNAATLSRHFQIKNFSLHNPYPTLFERNEGLNKRIAMFPLEQQTLNYTCFAASLRLIMKFYAAEYESFSKIPSERQLSKLFKTTPTEGTDLEYAYQCLIAQGYYCEIGKLENMELSELLDALLNLIRHGIPLLVNSLNNIEEGHYSVIIDVTTEGHLVFADPGRRYERDVSFYSYSKENFLARWKDSQGVAGRYFILYPNKELQQNLRPQQLELNFMKN